MLDWTLQIGAVTLGPGTNYIVLGINGLGTTDLSTSDQKRSQQDGAFLGTDTYGPRTLAIDCIIRGTDSVSATQAYDALLAEWQLRAGEDTRTLTFQIPGRPTMAAIGRPRRVSADNFAKLKTRSIAVTLEFFSAYSTLLTDPANNVTIPISTITTGRGYNATFARSYGGAGTSGIQTVVNNGNRNYFPTVTINGPCVNPTLENITTGDLLNFGITLGGGDTLTIDMDLHSVVLNGTASRRNAVLPGSSWWPLAPGSNQIRYNASSGAGSSAVVAARSAYLG